MSIQKIFVFILIIILLASLVYYFIIQIGKVCRFFMEEKSNESLFQLGIRYLTGKIQKQKPQKGFLAPSLLLKQFVQQVKLYAHEKYFAEKFKDQAPLNPLSAPLSNTQLLTRRWNDVHDTLDEFEIYLAQDPQTTIDNLISKSSKQNIDVSNIFQEIAELFENTWRPKNVNIEHAIVVPLKAYINEKLLKRILIGPWRACVYIAPRGGSVIFSAKPENNSILARWECPGITLSENFYDNLKNKSLTINERLEIGMNYISNDPKNSNILLGLISLIIWHDLAVAAGIRFNISQGNEGMIIKVTL